jgi:hypothetical protein
MRDQFKQPALLANLAGPHLPPVALSVSSQYQCCVDAGAAAAVGFFDDLAAVGLHDHIACSMQVFTSSVRGGMAAVRDDSAATMQACIDAFAAGYLGRIQQELRLFHGESAGRNQAAMDGRMFASSRTSH